LDQTFDRLKRYLSEPALASIITDSLSQKETAKLLASLGCVFPGVRTESLGRRELAEAFAGDAWQNPELFASLQRALDRVHQADMDEIRRLQIQEIETTLKRIPEICREPGRIGKVVWSLLRDGREEAARQIPSFLNAVTQFLNKEFKRADRKAGQVADFKERFLKGDLGKGEIRVVQDMMASVLDRKKGLEKTVADSQKRIDSILTERVRWKEELAAARRRQHELEAELSRARKEIEKKENALREFQGRLAHSREQTKQELRSDLHHLERENRKLQHELDEIRRQFAESQTELAAKREVSIRLGGELEQERRERAALVKALEKQREQNQKALEKPAPLLKHGFFSAPKDKGRRLGIFVDLQNILITAKRLRRKIDFQKLLEFLVLDRHLVKAVAYGVEAPEWDQSAFFEMLKRKGFEVHIRTLIRRGDGSAKGDWDTGIVVDAIRMVDQKDLDIVLVVSGDGDFIDLLKFLKMKGVRVEAAGFPFNTALDLPKSADEFFPLGENVLKTEEMPAFLPARP